MRRAGGARLKLDVLVESDRWQNVGVAKATVQRALKQAAAALLTKTAELAIVLTDDAAMRMLNRNWRGVDAATNVLSFATNNPGTRHSLSRPGNQLVGNHLGDIVVAYETVKREARRDGKPFDHHLAHLVVHGFLHLLGYGHMNDAQARRMEAAERTILCELAVPDPYSTPSSVRHAGHRATTRARRGRAHRVQNA
jgi:probable rRNA maturation factor